MLEVVKDPQETTEETKQEAKPEIPRDLQEKVAAIGGVVQAHKLLNTGLFQHQHMGALAQSLTFLQLLYKELLQSAKEHPEAETVPDLKAIIEAERKSQTNGGEQ